MQSICAKDYSFASVLRPGDRIVVGQGTAEPRTLLRRLIEEARAGLLPEVVLFVGPVYSDSFAGDLPECLRIESYGGIGGASALARAGRLDLYPTHVSCIDRDFRDGRLRADVALLSLRPALSGKGLSLGIARDYTLSAARRSRAVIGELQPEMPACFGGDLTEDLPIEALVRAETGLLELSTPPGDDCARAIARRIADLVPDGAVLQLGVGTIPALVCGMLTGHRDLGVHSGALVDGIVDLADSGALTNARKEHDRGVGVGGILLGTRRLYDFANANPAFRLAGQDETHSLDAIAGLSRFHAINSALEVDLTGQIGAETVGGRYLGAIGGQVDFVRAAQMSKGGRAIIALPATTRKGQSRIVTRVDTVTCTRADADTIVTEHGVAELRGQPISERVRRMIAIAAPECREALARDWYAAQGVDG